MISQFDVKKTSDRRAMLNIGCGVKTHPDWNNVDSSPYARLAGKRRLSGLLRQTGILSELRYERVRQVDPEMIHHDLRRGLPFADNVFDVVYHSHFIAHVDRRAAEFITAECFRVLRPGGIHRIVTNDFEALVDEYRHSIDLIEAGENGRGMQHHEEILDELFELMVHDVPYGTQQQRPAVRFVERIARNPDSTGERRRWYYDRFSLRALMQRAGFTDVQTVDARQSRIPAWNSFGLDLNADGSLYKQRSIYMEGIKPRA